MKAICGFGGKIDYIIVLIYTAPKTLVINCEPTVIRTNILHRCFDKEERSILTEQVLQAGQEGAPVFLISKYLSANANK